MTDILLIANFILVLITIVVIFLILKKINLSANSESQNELRNLLAENYDRIEKSVRNEISISRDELQKISKDNREESSKSINQFGDNLFRRMSEISKMQKDQLDIFSQQLSKLTQSNEEKFDKLQEKISVHLKEIRDNNEKKLEEMRVTVDEKLHDTLEKRLGESFKLVSDRLEIVHKGLGEMQTLANGVGDLKRVLSNVKTRGTWGEIQLGNLIEQVLSPEQYAKDTTVVPNSRERVDFAIKLPGKSDNTEEVVWLPIDAKFPLEDYQRLIDATDSGNTELIDNAAKEIIKRIKIEAKSISDKYIKPPHTTDFAIMFLPIEGLYAEVLRTPGLAEILQREFRITIAGPTNIMALLNSLQMGFRTLAIEKRSSEVWKLLGAVKSEFGKFGDILDKTHKKLQEASNTIDNATRKSRTIERKLRDVQELPQGETDDDLFLE